MHTMKQQRGLTMISWLLIATVVGFFIMVSLKLVPVYLEYYSIKQVLASIEHEPRINRKPVGEIRTMLQRRFDMNSIRNLTRDNVKIRRSGGITKIDVNYEERRPIVGNLDVIMTFSESLELTAN